MSYWASVECPVCRLRYRDFRFDGQVSFKEAKHEMVEESVKACAGGDYSKPASRRAVLGRMFAYKQAAWEGHRDACDRYESGEVD